MFAQINSAILLIPNQDLKYLVLSPAVPERISCSINYLIPLDWNGLAFTASEPITVIPFQLI
jgi:hypothetical protein